MNKKAFAVSVNFVIILILSIMIFTIGIYIVNRFFDFAKEEKLRWDDMTRREIDAALDYGDRVAIPRYKTELANGEFYSFGAGILNVLQGPPTRFNVRITFSFASLDGVEICDYTTADTCGYPNSWIRTSYDEEPMIDFELELKNNEKKNFLIGFDVDGAPEGTYVFNVDIDYFDPEDGWEQYDTTHKIYIEVVGSGSPTAGSAMRLFSSGFSYGEEIPPPNRCGVVNPELEWFNVPDSANSFALIVEDSDTGDAHWLIKNIPPSTAHIGSGSSPPGSILLLNDFGSTSYSGPCISGHHYYFRLYALDAGTLTANNKAELYNQVEDHKIKKSELMGTIN